VDQAYSEIEKHITSRKNDQQEISILTRQLNDYYSPLPVKISSVKIFPVTRYEFYRKLSVKIEMTGDIQDILHFINLLEKNPQPVRIERLAMTARDIVDQVQASFLVTKMVTLDSNKTTTKGAVDASSTRS
jgi:Tfp pilus assembly protein PilO